MDLLCSLSIGLWALAFEVILRGGTVVAVVERGEFCWVLRAVLFL